MISRKNEGVKILPAKMSGWLSHALLRLKISIGVVQAKTLVDQINMKI